MTESTHASLAAWVATYVAETSRAESVDAFVAYVDARILSELPELASDPVLVAELHANTKAQFQVFLSLLQRERQELLLPPQAIDLTLSIARRHLELAVLLRIFWVAEAAVWEYFTQASAAVPPDGPDRTDVLIYLWDHGWTWLNQALEQLIGVYSDERDKTVQGTLAGRTELVHAILGGDAISADTATTDLGHQVRGIQTALVLWVDGGHADDAMAPLNDLASALATAIGAGRPLTVPVGRREIWAWLATRSAPDLAPLREVITGQSSVRATMGLPSPGLDGFRQSHREAVDAQRIAVSGRSDKVLSEYADVELACLVGGNERGVRALISRELGPLAGNDKGLDRVRETVAAYLAHGGSVETTANTLIVHKNTIRYRLAQAEDLIGHPLSERRTELALALQCLDAYGA